jgi:selenocysteine lyase/cysteine desulfurase
MFRLVTCDSPKKFFGPHAGALYGKYALLNELKAYKVRPAGDELPYKFETGTQNLEGIAGVLGALEYFEWLGRQFGVDQESAWKEAGFRGRRLELKKGMSAMRAYETGLSKTVIGIVESVPGTRIHGVTVRVGPVHYNTVEELEKFGEGLEINTPRLQERDRGEVVK